MYPHDFCYGSYEITLFSVHASVCLPLLFVRRLMNSPCCKYVRPLPPLLLGKGRYILLLLLLLLFNYFSVQIVLFSMWSVSDQRKARDYFFPELHVNSYRLTIHDYAYFWSPFSVFISKSAISVLCSPHTSHFLGVVDISSLSALNPSSI
jgi:hypothetical protein